MKCKHCDCDMKKCISLWKGQKKCCPDCICTQEQIEIFDSHFKFCQTFDFEAENSEENFELQYNFILSQKNGSDIINCILNYLKTEYESEDTEEEYCCELCNSVVDLPVRNYGYGLLCENCLVLVKYSLIEVN